MHVFLEQHFEVSVQFFVELLIEPLPSKQRDETCNRNPQVSHFSQLVADTTIAPRPGTRYHGFMQDIAIQKAHELPADARQAVERMLGRNLEEDEEISIMALSPHQAPAGQARLALAHQLEARMNQTAGRIRNIPDETQEEAINEAVDYVRSHPQ
ncbi:MAG TPA: hypothetical protein VMT20_15935 [Terriglobia bacterium]|nr:hypothetical protein [Terriglobia bacterium]